MHFLFGCFSYFRRPPLKCSRSSAAVGKSIVCLMSSAYALLSCSRDCLCQLSKHAPTHARTHARTLFDRISGPLLVKNQDPAERSQSQLSKDSSVNKLAHDEDFQATPQAAWRSLKADDPEVEPWCPRGSGLSRPCFDACPTYMSGSEMCLLRKRRLWVVP